MPGITVCAKCQNAHWSDRPCGDCALAALKLTINSPETDDFMKAIPLEAAHQKERWNDADKSDVDWVFLFGWLAGKATHAARSGDMVKAKHHAITASAAMFNWHSQLNKPPS